MEIIISITIGIIILSSFALFSRAVKREQLKDLDFAVTIKTQENIPHRLTPILLTAKEAGNPLLTSIGIALITIIYILKQKTWKRRGLALIIPFGFTLITLGEIYGKTTVPHPSPFFFLLKNTTTDFPEYYIHNDYSYPSGHAARSLFIALALFTITMPTSFMKKGIWGGILAGYTGIISFSVIYLGQHWFSDVIGSFLLTIGIFFFTLNPLLNPKK